MSKSEAYRVRLAHPNRALKADYKNSRSAAIDLFCLQCMGSNTSSLTAVKNCTDVQCPLWTYRPGKCNKVRPPGVVPTEAQLRKKITPRTTKVSDDDALNSLLEND